MSDVDLPIGAIVERDGVQLRHIGGGRFVRHQPAPDIKPDDDPLLKRFDTSMDGPLTGVPNA